MRVTILQNRASGGAARLAQALRLALPGVSIGRGTAASVKRCRGIRYVIRWGCSEEPVRWAQRQLIESQPSAAVKACQCKAATLRALDEADAPHIKYLPTDQGDRELHQAVLGDWLEEDGKIVVRHTTTGHSGAGIEIVRRGRNNEVVAIPAAPLYTRYFRKDAEYRVHVAFGNTILIQQKRKRNNIEQTPEQALIRTHGNGWVFTTANRADSRLGYTEQLSALALDAARAVGASHCAVDILVRHRTNHPNTVHNMVVCELNSAPGIEAGSTLEAYTTAFANEIRRLT